MFDPGFSFEHYVEWLLDVPMYFVYRDGRYVNMTDRTFRQFMAGSGDDTGAGAPTLGDFADHMTTAFTDVRVKRFLEMRGADAGSPEMMVAQSALWVGLLYDPAALEAAHALVRRHDWRIFTALRAAVPREGLAASWGTGSLRDLARDVVSIANDGLRARARLDSSGRDETTYLAPLHEIAEGGMTQAERWLSRYEDVWARDVTRIWDEAAI
jgi:glutamate--cysteine ligase